MNPHLTRFSLRLSTIFMLKAFKCEPTFAAARLSHPRERDSTYTLKLSPQEQLEVALGLLNLKPPEIKALE